MLAFLAVLVGVGCKVSTNLDQVVALEVVLPDGGQLEIGDTLFPRARALNGHGDTVTSNIFWEALDTAVIAVLDSSTGATLGKAIGSGRVEALVGLLRSNPQAITVIPHLDSVLALGPTRDTVSIAADSLSDSLGVQLFSSPPPASNRRVVFAATTFPAGAPLVTFVPKDTLFSSFSGVAAVRLRLTAGNSPPDSVVVTATVQRPDGTPIPGSPVTFVVEYRP
ncbi:MAG TPA: hypothetical protein VG454_03140 [Gemmatimonadales bacterium]|nr:hypothetical protein [Gemmatimonadales bacterium]